eukprot:8818578-Pyramimonas_sp.AAC.1
MLSLSVRTALCKWEPEPCSCRQVFRRHIGPTRSDTSAYAEGQSSWWRRFGCKFDAPLLPFGSLVRCVPPPESRFRTAKTGATVIPGIYLGYVHKAGGLVEPDSYVVP